MRWPEFIVGLGSQAHVLGQIDATLVRFSRLFGTGLQDQRLQHAALLATFTALHIAGFIAPPKIGWVLLWLGFVGVLGVGRAWVANEKLRTSIARKLSDADPDELPDLRFSALLSALQLIVIVPLLLRSSHELFDLYALPPDVSFSDWLLLGVDLLFRSILDWSEIYGIQLSGIELDAMGGRHLVMLFLLTIDFILIQGLFRIFEIRRTVSEGVAAAVRDPEMATRLGQRAVPSLLDMLDGEELELDERRKVIQALAVLREARACEAILRWMNTPEVETTAIAAMVAIGETRPLIDALDHRKTRVRNGAITALGRIGAPSSVQALHTRMQVADAELQVRLVGAIARHERVETVLHDCLDNAHAQVRLIALQALSNDGSETLMHRLVEMASDGDADVRLAVVDALQRFSDGRVVPPLVAALEDGDARVARQAQRSLDHLQSVVARKGGASDQ